MHIVYKFQMHGRGLTYIGKKRGTVEMSLLGALHKRGAAADAVPGPRPEQVQLLHQRPDAGGAVVYALLLSPLPGQSYGHDAVRVKGHSLGRPHQMIPRAMALDVK